MNASTVPPTSRRPRPAWLLPLLGTLVAVATWLLLRGSGPSEAPFDGPAPRVAPAPTDGSALDAGKVAPGPTRGGTPPLRAHRPATAAEVRGIVLDANALPLVGAQLALRAVDAGALRGLAVPDGDELARTTSASDGTFVLPAPVAGTARVTAWAPAHGQVAELVGPAGGRLTLVLAREALLDVLVRAPDGRSASVGQVEVEVGRTRQVQALEAGHARVDGLPAGAARVRVVTPEGSVGAAGPLLLEAGALREVLVVLVPGARLGGVVLDSETDEPLAQASVIVAQPGRALAPSTTPPSGRFGPLVAGAPGESLQVSVQAPGYQSALLAVTLSEGPEALEIEVRLTPAEAWTGRVEHLDGTPAAGVEVGYTPDGIAGRTPASTTTDPEGRFALPPPPPPAPGRRIVLVARSDSALAALALRPDTPCPEPLVLRLARGATLSGRVLDDHGRALEGVIARAMPAWEQARASAQGNDLLHAINAGGSAGLSGLSEFDGRFEISGVPPGPWWISLERAESTRSLDTPLTVEAGDIALGDLTLGGGLALEGLVLTPTGTPVAGVRVRLGPVAETARRPQSALTDRAGRFHFSDLVAERVWVEAEGAGGQGERLREELELPAPGTLTLRVSRGQRLTLDLRGPEGPVSGWVTLALTRPRAGEQSGYRASVAVEGGQAVFEDVPPGRWNLHAKVGTLLALAPEFVEVDPLREARLSLSLVAPALLHGLLRTAAGAPVAGGEIVLRASAGGAARRTLSDAEGRYRYEGLTAGEHLLRAQGPGGAPIERRLSLSAGQDADESLTLAPAGGLQVRVLDERGLPQANALVVVRAAANGTIGSSAQGRTNPHGLLLLMNLPPTSVVVSARTRDGLVGSARVDLVADRVVEVPVSLTRR